MLRVRNTATKIVRNVGKLRVFLMRNLLLVYLVYGCRLMFNVQTLAVDIALCTHSLVRDSSIMTQAATWVESMPQSVGHATKGSCFFFHKFLGIQRFVILRTDSIEIRNFGLRGKEKSPSSPLENVERLAIVKTRWATNCDRKLSHASQIPFT